MKLIQVLPGRVRCIIIALLVFTFIPIQMTMGTEKVQKDLITQAEIQNLPQPVQRFLEYSGVIGTPRITQATIEQTGFFKIAPDKPWVPFTATQVCNIPEASFEWKVRMKMAPLMIVKGKDALKGGCGSMKIKLFGLIPLVNAKGPEIDQGAMTRYLGETIWFPQAFLDDHIRWEAIDSVSAKAIFTIAEKSVEGIFHFDVLGPVTSFTCDRYASEGKELVLTPWQCPVDEYKVFNGIQIAAKARAIWDRPESEYTYIKLEVTRVDYE